MKRTAWIVVVLMIVAILGCSLMEPTEAPWVPARNYGRARKVGIESVKKLIVFHENLYLTTSSPGR